tara:strand:+ start:2885 stop:3178 length:294 start_codon:yes stop_codon:yes gene_type:complete
MVDFYILHLIEIGGLIAILGLMFQLKALIIETLDDLSIDLATALQGTIAKVAENVEPANPLQQIILQWLANNANQAEGGPAIVDILTDDQGRFAKKD